MPLGLYRPSFYSENDFSFHLENALSYYTTIYENITLIGDFNMNRDKNKFLNYFNETLKLKNLLKEPTCFKSQNPSMIDLILTNHRSSFMKTAVLESGISDHHKIIFSILKHTFAKGPLKTICYRDLKNFDQKAFNSCLESKIADCPNSFEKFLQIFQDTAQLFSLLKKKVVRYKNKMFMTKSLRKVTMARSKLRSKCNKNRTPKNWIIFFKKKQMRESSKKCKKEIFQ